MVKITRVHGFREYQRQLDRNSTLERGHCVHDDCIMFGGDCSCNFFVDCKYKDELKEKEMGE